MCLPAATQDMMHKQLWFQNTMTRQTTISNTYTEELLCSYVLAHKTNLVLCAKSQTAPVTQASCSGSAKTTRLLTAQQESWDNYEQSILERPLHGIKDSA